MGNHIYFIREPLNRRLKKAPLLLRLRRPCFPLDLRSDCAACAPARWLAIPLAGAALFVWTSLVPQRLTAQTAATPQTTAQRQTKAATATHASKAARTPATDRKRTATHHHALVHPAKTAAPAAPPPAPPKPNWPIDRPPTPAKVTWDSQGLSIEASNSSLVQILREVATDTGVTIQGLNQDERIYGNYGPGPAREVLSQLLDGSGYNVLMVGGAGDAAPQQIILSPSVKASSQPAASAQNSNDDEDTQAEEQPQPPQPEQPMPMRSPFGPGAQRVPLEMQQDMEIRQHQQQQNNPQY